MVFATAMLLLLVFHYVPALGNVIAFQDYNPYLGDTPLQAFLSSPWIGLENFRLMAEDRFLHAGRRDSLEQPLEEASSAHLDQTLRPSPRMAEQALADPRGEEHGRHPASTAPSASRKRVKSAAVRCPMLATRKISRARRPCPS